MIATGSIVFEGGDLGSPREAKAKPGIGRRVPPQMAEGILQAVDLPQPPGP